MKQQVALHGRDHDAGGSDPVCVLLHVKCFGDNSLVAAGDDARKTLVTDDLGGTYLRSAHAYVTTPSGTGDIEIMIRNETQSNTDLLTDPITIDATEDSSYTSAAPSLVDRTVNKVERSDLLVVDVDSAGSGAAGLEVLLEFGPQILTT